MNSELSEIGKSLLYLVFGAIFILLGLITSWLLRPNRPNPEKNTNYECGEDTVGNAWSQFNIRFYVMGLVFLIFDVELILIFPWAYSFFDNEIMVNNPQWNWMSLIEILFFLFILLAGLYYIVLKKDIDWVKPKPLAPKCLNVVPIELYVQFNKNHEKNTNSND